MSTNVPNRTETSGLKAENARLRAALHRIDGINDNPAIYNSDIEAVLRTALDPVDRRTPAVNQQLGEKK